VRDGGHPGYHTTDEALALSTAFIGAGCAGAIASLWSVDHYATPLRMARFYEELVATPKEPARDLCAAQLWLRDLSAEDQQRYVVRRPALAELRARRSTANDAAEHDQGRDRRGSAGFGARTMWPHSSLEVREATASRVRSPWRRQPPSAHALGVSAISAQELGVPAGSPDGVSESA
jgi:CHAT domain-containing protein